MRIIIIRKNPDKQKGMDAETELLDMARSGAWTLSEMSMMVKDAAKIDSGTGEVTGYGLDVRNNRSFFYYIAGCDVKIAVTGENNFATLWAVYESQVTKDYNDFIKVITN